MGSHRVEIIFVCFRERRGIEQLLNSAHDGRSGPGVPLQVAWFAGQLGHIEGVVVLEMWNCSLSFRACSRFSRVSVP